MADAGPEATFEGMRESSRLSLEVRMPFCSSRRALAVFFALCLVGCEEKEPGAGGNEKPGLGDSNAPPSGTKFVFPAGLALEAAPHGYAYLDDPHCPDFQETEIHGSGGLVTLCLSIRNTTDAAIELELPPGLVFVSESTEVQNGLLTELVIVTVPAQTVVPLVVSAYCTNLSRDVPDDANVYAIGPITDDPDLLELLELLDGLDLPGDGTSATDEELAAISLVQTAVWEITDYGGLTAETRAAVESL